MMQAATMQSDAVSAFFGCVLGDGALQARLGAIVADDVFVREAVAIAAEHGFALTEGAIAAAIRPDPLGLSRFQSAPVTCHGWPAPGWLPARSVATGDVPMIDWTWMDSPSRAPFYEDDVRRSAALPFSRMFRTRTSLNAVIDGSAGAPVPDGLIFHMSRCGSTLVAQMLAAVPHHSVVSEPEPLDAVVQWARAGGVPIDTQVAALRAIAGAVGRGAGQRFFLKLDSWHATALPLFRLAFPDTPWIFLYRDPVEVMVSHMRIRGLQTVAGALPGHVFGIADGETMASEQHCAEVLRRTCSAVLEHWDLGGGMLVDYAELPAAMLSRIPAHFGFAPDAAEMAAMAEASTRSAKAPSERFAADGARKRAEASPAVRGAAAAQLAAVHVQLQALRGAAHA